MDPLTQTITFILASLTVAGQFIFVISLGLFFFKRDRNKTAQFLARHAILFSFIVALTATSGSLFYSEVAGFDPCKLCWLQRIFMYPMVLILPIALWKKDRGIAKYTLALSAVGFVIALYHYLLQLGWVPAVACDVVGYSASCAQVFVMTFGYITIPMMALTAFGMILLFSLHALLLNPRSHASHVLK